MNQVWPLLLVAAFALVNGANDGSSLVAAGLRVRSLRPLTAACLLVGGLVAMPFLAGTAVATTLATRLVGFDTVAGPAAVAVAVGGATTVVFVLSRLGLPTSLTLALVGGIAGAGLGFGLPVSWRTAGFVVALGALAPLAGAAGAVVLSRLAGRLLGSGGVNRRLRRWHRFGFGAQCVAYGANDGQKMLAVAAVALGGAVRADPLQLALVGSAFALGLLLGLRRMARTLADRLLAVRPTDAVAAGLSSATAVCASAAAGAPVSMTQSLAGALVGSALARGSRGVRWRVVLRVAMAWLLTLPAAGVVAGVAGLVAS